MLDKLADGVSIAIAPEGTRSLSDRLGPFKKGAFHIAMQAGVPIVPIVIRNAGELMWRNSFWLRPGTVDVRVLEPDRHHRRGRRGTSATMPSPSASASSRRSRTGDLSYSGSTTSTAP